MHGRAYVSSGSGARLLRGRMLQFEQGRKTVEIAESVSAADRTQSISQTGHFIYCAVYFTGWKMFRIGIDDALVFYNSIQPEKDGPDAIRTHDRPVMSRAL